MAFYLVKYMIGNNNEYVYPNSVKRVIWNSTLYHSSENTMVGETDDDVQPDGTNVIALTPDEAEKLKKEYLSSTPENEE